MRKKIAVSNLKVGMQVVDTGLSWLEHPYLYSKPGAISSSEEIQSLLAEGYTEAFIELPGACPDTDGLPCGPEGEFGNALDLERVAKAWEPYAETGNTHSIKEELGPAKHIYSESLDMVRDCLKDARMGSHLDYARSEELVDTVIDSVIRNSDALISLTKLRAFDSYTYTHSINVSVLTLAFAKHLNFPREVMQPLGIAALMHDMGKARIPDAILNKPGKLTPEEFEIIKLHPGKGVQLLERQQEFTDEILRGVGEHHEKYNGKGYPKGLDAEQISLFGSVISLADVYDALTSKRVYKKGIQPNKAMGTIFSMRGQDFFPAHVERFVRFLGIYPIGSMVQLSSGFYALVISPNPGDPLHPNVKVILDRQGRSCMPQDLNLSRLKDEDPEGSNIVKSFDPKEFRVDPSQYLL